MQKWEYMYEEFFHGVEIKSMQDSEDAKNRFRAKMNEWGQDGWEIISIERTSDSYTVSAKGALG